MVEHRVIRVLTVYGVGRYYVHNAAEKGLVSESSRLFEDFDPVDFRELCSNLDDVPDIQALAELLANVLEDEHKSLIVRYLKAVAEADGEMSTEEARLLDRISAALGVGSTQSNAAQR